VTGVVVGGGLAGAVAALELAGRGLDVVLVRAAPGATALTWGTLDVAGASPLRRGGLPLRDAASGPLLAPRRRLEAVARPPHPYSVLWPTAPDTKEVEEAAAALHGWLAPVGLPVRGSLDHGRWLADVHGAVRVADLALGSVLAGDLAEAEEVALVELPGLPGFEVRAALRALGAELTALEGPGRPLRALRLALPPGLAELCASPARLARALDDSAARDTLAPALASLGAPGRLLLVPPVLGLTRPEAVQGWVREASGCAVAELVGSPALGLAGYRLDRALGAALERAGVAVRQGRVVSVETSEGAALAVRMAAPGGGAPERIPLDRLVLATGRFLGGGLRERDGVLAEPLLGLPLYDLDGQRVDGAPARRLVRPDYEAEQPLFAAGVRTDARLRPLGADGTPLLANAFAAGELLGGFDPARERDGLGVALLTGRRVADEATPC
jgi:glycerol-3-phosphate dehydrogenase subunit B